MELDDSATYSIAEYVQLEEYSNIKHEFVDGQIRAMGGGTLEHARLAMALGAMLGAQLRGRPCAVYSSDARVRVAGQPVITYPDLSIGCGPAETDTDDPLAQLNPTVLIEITSPSSERYDRGKKFARYQQITSLREYVVVSHRERVIDVFRRGADGSWSEAERFGSGQPAQLRSIGCEVDVDELYRDPRAAQS